MDPLVTRPTTHRKEEEGVIEYYCSDPIPSLLFLSQKKRKKRCIICFRFHSVKSMVVRSVDRSTQMSSRGNIGLLMVATCSCHGRKTVPAP